MRRSGCTLGSRRRLTQACEAALPGQHCNERHGTASVYRVWRSHPYLKTVEPPPEWCTGPRADGGAFPPPSCPPKPWRRRMRGRARERGSHGDSLDSRAPHERRWRDFFLGYPSLSWGSGTAYGTHDAAAPASLPPLAGEGWGEGVSAAGLPGICRVRPGAASRCAQRPWITPGKPGSGERRPDFPLSRLVWPAILAY